MSITLCQLCGNPFEQSHAAYNVRRLCPACEETHAYCPDCDSIKLRDEFGKNKKRRNGLQYICKLCFNERSRNFYEDNRDRISVTRKSRLKGDPDLRENIKAVRRDQYHLNHKTRKANYFQSNKERITEQRRQYRQTPDGKAAKRIIWHRREGYKKNTPNTLTPDEWSEILDRQNYRCAHCGRCFSANLPPTMDHIRPVSLGGGLTKENTQALCGSCNSKKGNRFIG